MAGVFAVLLIFGLPIVVIVTKSMEKMARLRAQGGGPDAMARFDALEADVAELRQELTETQERLDYAERLLTQQKQQQLSK